jgi:hypothetical protein
MNASSQSGPILWIFGFSLLASAGAICLTGSFLLLPPGIRQRLVPHLISYAIGTLLGAAFLGLIPHALADIPTSNVFAVLLAGIVVFIVLERLMLWRHCHEAQCEVHSASGVLILIGDGVHNFVDGILIAATFLTSVPLGIATSLAIVSHEVPQEVGDFAILLESGYSAARARLSSKSGLWRKHARRRAACVRLVAAPALGGALLHGAGGGRVCVCRDGRSGAGAAPLRQPETVRLPVDLDRRRDGNHGSVSPRKPC